MNILLNAISKFENISTYDINKIINASDEELDSLISHYYEESMRYDSSQSNRFDYLLGFSIEEAKRRISMEASRKRFLERKHNELSNR